MKPANRRRYETRQPRERERERERENSAGSRHGEELDRKLCSSPAEKKLRDYLIDCIRRGVVEINYAESTVTKDGMVSLGINDTNLAGARIHFDLYKRLRQIASGEIVDKDWSGYVRSNTGGYWKKSDHGKR